MALLAAEAAVRVLGLAPGYAAVRFGQFRTSADPELLWEPVPGADDLNSLGLRGSELEQPKRRLRVLVIGDSVAFGVNLPENQTIPRRLQHHLGGRGIDCEVVNGGVPGYNTIQEARWLETRIAAVAPDRVLVLYCLNDAEPLAGLPEGTLRAANRAAAADALALVHRSRAVSAPWRALLGTSHLARMLYRWRAGIQLGTAVQRRQGVAETHRRLEDVRAGLRRIHASAAAHGAPVLFAIVPVFRGLAGDYPFPAVHAMVADLAGSVGLPVVDLLPAASDHARRTGRGLGLPGDALHPDAGGADALAAVLAGALAAQVAGR